LDSFDYRDDEQFSQEEEINTVLRPKTFNDFSGQKKVTDNLGIFVEAAKLRDESLDHVLLHGPPGLGKTTLANIIANEMGVGIKITSGPVLDKPGDLAGLLTNLEEGTTRSGLLTAPLRARFGINSRLEYYDVNILSGIITRASGILEIEIHENASMEISRRSRGTPRIANALLRRVRDFAQIKGDGVITIEIANMALEALNVDQNGLDEMDNKILSVIIDKFNGGPVGMSTIATAVSENPGTIEEVYEPYLIKEGYLLRTPRGRKATEKAFKHLGRDLGYHQSGLF